MISLSFLNLCYLRNAWFLFMLFDLRSVEERRFSKRSASARRRRSLLQLQPGPLTPAACNQRCRYSLRFVYYHFWGRFAHLDLRAHSLDLRGLLFHRCRETLNRTFQFRDSRLRFEEFVEHNLWSR